VGILIVLQIAVLVTGACGAETYNPDENSPSARAVVMGTVTDRLDRPAGGAKVTSRIFRDSECQGEFGTTGPPSTTDSAGRFTRHEAIPFSNSFQACVLLRADPSSGGVLVPDSVSGLVEFRAEGPADTLIVSIRLGDAGLSRD
jgi:hypothetical protein